MKTKKLQSILVSVLVLVLLLASATACGKKADDSSAESAGSGTEEQVKARSKADQKQLDQDIEDGYLILVNKQNYLPSDYIPEDLEGLKYYAKDRSPDARFLRKTAADHFHEMVEAAQEEDIDIVSTTAYRSYAFQKNLYTSYVSTKGQEEADKVSAKPGSSEHQTGLSADLSTSEINYVNGSAFGTSAAGKWIAEHCWEYGFIVRYPDGLEDITGYTYEPWHVRYVGMVAAKEIYKEDITLEEYIKENKISNVEIVEPQK
jgi:D-alanyl-D-alanine carboxypeptidase